MDGDVRAGFLAIHVNAREPSPSRPFHQIMKQQREREERTRQKEAGGGSAPAPAEPQTSPPSSGGASHTQLSPSEFARLATQRALSLMGASRHGSDSPAGVEAGGAPPPGSQPLSGAAGSGHAADSAFGEEPLPGAPLAEYFLQVRLENGGAWAWRG